MLLFKIIMFSEMLASTKTQRFTTKLAYVWFDRVNDYKSLEANLEHVSTNHKSTTGTNETTIQNTS